MSLLNVLRRKKRKHVREDAWDTPTLFAGMGNDPHHEEKKISVLSAAGGKPAKRAKSRSRTGKSVPMIRTPYIVLFLGTVLFAGIWQSGVLDRNVGTAVAGKLDAWWQAGFSVFDQSGSSPADASSEQQARVSLPTPGTSASMLETDTSGQAPLIERVELPGQNKPELSAQSPAEMLNAPLNRDVESGSAMQSGTPVQSGNQAAQVTEKPAASVQAKAHAKAKAPTPGKTASETVRTNERHHAKSAPIESSRQGAAAEKSADKKIQTAKSKEQDADVQLLEALLVNVRKTEAAKVR